MNEQEFSELAAGYALNALSPEDEREYAAALLEHPEWNHIVVADAATAAALARGVAQVSPPLGARGALLSLIARTPQYPPRSADLPASATPDRQEAATQEAATETPSELLGLPLTERSAQDEAPDPSVGALAEATPEPVERTPTEVVQTVARRGWMRGVFALAASLALLVSLGFGAALIGQQIGRSPAVIALERIEDASDVQTAGVAVESGGEATAVWSESLGEAVLVTDGLPALPSGETYQLWFIRGDQTIVSAGLFATDREGETTSLLDGTVQSGDTIAVSVEPAGGSDQPTTTPIIAIATET